MAPIPKDQELVYTPIDYFFYIDEDIYFRPLIRADLKGRWPQWFNDPEVTHFTKGFYPNTIELQEAYFNQISGSHTDVILAIVSRSSNEHVGNVGLHQIDYVHRSAILGIVIGEKFAWGKGIGSKSWRAITNYGFSVLNLQKICATVLNGNEASLKCALNSGYKIEGRQERQIYKNGSYHDLIHLGLLREHWKV